MDLFKLMFFTIAIVVLANILITGIKYSKDTLQNRTRLSNLLFYMFLGFAIVLIFDSFRMINFTTIAIVDPLLQTYFHIFKVFVILFSYPIAFRIHVLILEYMGKDKLVHKIIRFYSMSLAVVFSILNIFTLYTSAPNYFGFYTQQINPLIGIIMIIAYLPLNLWIVLENRKIVGEITDQNTKFQLNLLTYLVLFLTGERMSSIMGYGILMEYFFISIDVLLIIHWAFIIGAVAYFMVLILKYSDFVEKIGIFFAVKSIFLIKKSGQLIYEYDFEEKISKDAHSSENLLVGGFIFAVTEGFREMLRIYEDISSFSSGERTIIIQHGEYIFGVLIVNEKSNLMKQKLNQFVIQYENKYKDVFMNWTGEITAFKLKIAESMLFDIFQ